MGFVRCPGCGEEAEKRKVYKSRANLGRYYYKCWDCDIWICWADDVDEFEVPTDPFWTPPHAHQADTEEPGHEQVPSEQERRSAEFREILNRYRAAKAEESRARQAHFEEYMKRKQDELRARQAKFEEDIRRAAEEQADKRRRERERREQEAQRAAPRRTAAAAAMPAAHASMLALGECSEEELRQFLAQAGAGAGAESEQLMEKSALLELALRKQNAWEVRRLIACGKLRGDAKRRGAVLRGCTTWAAAKKLHRELSLKVHPDKHREEVDLATQAFQVLQEALDSFPRDA